MNDFPLILLEVQLYILTPSVYLQKEQRNTKSETSQNHWVAAAF